MNDAVMPLAAAALPGGPGRWSDWYLGAMKLAVGALLALLIALFWLLQENDNERQRATLIADVLWLEQSINFVLAGNTEHLAQLADDLAREHDKAALFSLRSRHLQRNNRELEQLVWLSSEGRRLAATPTQLAPRLGEGANGDEAFARTIELASKLAKPVYTEAYRAADGVRFEIMLPIFEGARYAGALVAVYSLDALLRELVPWWFAEKYEVRIDDANGKTLASKSKLASSATALSYSIPLDPPGYGITLKITPYRPVGGHAPALIAILIVLLGAAVLASLWIMRGHIRRRLVAEQALRAEHAFRKAMEDSLTVGMRARDLEGRLTYANPAFCQMVGYSIGELREARPPMPYWAPEELEKTQALHEAVMQGKPPREGFELRFMRKDGSRFDALIYEARLIDADGRHTGWMASVVDVSARKRIEEMALAQQEKLQLTSRLVTMGEMATMLAHELNQPLAAIASYNAGCLNKLAEGNGFADRDRDELRQALGKLGAQAQRAGRIVRRVHDFVKKREPALASCDVGEIIEESIGLVEPSAKRARVRLVRRIDGAYPLRHADRAMLEQVFVNLMRNAIDASSGVPLSRRRLTIALARTSEQVEIRVADEGCGLTGEVRDKLFTPFFSTKSEGMGMGLNICRTIVEFHHGRLWLEDNAPAGTVAVVTLPVALS